MLPETPGTPATAAWIARIRGNPATYLVLGLLILAVDIWTGPFLQFPVLFLVPVSFCAWYCGRSWAIALAVVLPLARLASAEYVDLIRQPAFLVANSSIRIAVLSFIAYFVARAARQQRELEARVIDFARICAWSRTVEYEGEWVSFEQYLERRFRQKTTHGISPAEAERMLATLKEGRSQ